MAFDSITNSTPNTEDFAKIKKVNRSAKLKQCKLDARRHHWLSQVLRRKTSLIERRRCRHDCMGEFNSGKSTFINALLGEKYLQDGVVPTTNEITFLRYSDLASNEQQRCERHPAGQYVCYLPAPILKEDTMARRPVDPEEKLRWMAQEVRGYVEAVLNSLAANVPKVGFV